MRGLVAAARANHAEAERWLRDAAADFRAGEQWFQLSLAELDLAGVVVARGRHAEARELAAAARRGFATQGNAHWSRRADVARSPGRDRRFVTREPRGAGEDCP